MEKQAEVKFEPKQILTCLDEVEGELFRIADNDECQRFQKDTPLTAMVLLLMRMSSLIRSLLLFLESRNFDGFDPVLRAFEETFYMAHELRLSVSADKAAAWLRGDKDTWSGKIGVRHWRPNFSIIETQCSPTRRYSTPKEIVRNSPYCVVAMASIYVDLRKD